MKVGRIVLGFFATTALVLADEPAPKKKSVWNVQIVPKAFQRNPELDITVLSELGSAGRQRRTVTVAEPAYYLFESAGYMVRGDAVQQKPFPASEVERILQRSLAASGYLPATADHPPTVAVIYMYGAHNVINPANVLSPDQ